MSEAAGGADHVVADQSEVFAFLAAPASHGIAAPVTRIDTHGAAVFLAGEDVYKVKRAVRFPFLDYGTLEKRRAACEAELAINRAHAPSLYLGVVAIRRAADGGLTLHGDGEPVEWAVHMRRFDLDATLDRVVERGPLAQDVVTALVRAVLRSHEAAPRQPEAPFAAAIERYIRDNATGLGETPDLFPPPRVRALTEQSLAALARVRELLEARAAQGYVRRCHGDLHLANVVLLDGTPTLFDAIEFDAAIATGDVLYDLAFLLMDLWQRDAGDGALRANANAVLNRYLWGSDAASLDGLAALPLFLSVRAAIRAKVTAARLAHADSAAREPIAAAASRYFACAESVLTPVPPRIVAVGGLSGTGKSTLAAALAPLVGAAPGAVHLRSDIERKRLFDVAETEKLHADGYRPEVTVTVYETLQRKAAQAVRAGSSVVIDAVHARPEERAAPERTALELGVPFTGLWLRADTALLLERVEGRRNDASDADAAIVRQQAEFDLGEVRWRTLDAHAPLADTVAAAQKILRAG